MAKKKYKKPDYTHRRKRSKKGGKHLTGPFSVEGFLKGQTKVEGGGDIWSMEKTILKGSKTRPYATKRQIKRGQFDKAESKAKRG